MSLACLECNRIGSFNTLIIFEPEGRFDTGKHVSSYPNFYTCCASLADFTEAEQSRFMIVEEREYQDVWHTGTNGARLGKTRHMRVNEAELQRKLPKIFERLTARRR